MLYGFTCELRKVSEVLLAWILSRRETTEILLLGLGDFPSHKNLRGVLAVAAGC
jgi:hypothetical protein